MVFIIFTLRSIFHLLIIYFNSKFINSCGVKFKSLALSTYLSSKVNDENFSEIKNVLNFFNSKAIRHLQTTCKIITIDKRINHIFKCNLSINLC